MAEPLIRQLLILLALNLYLGFSIPNVSNTAHIGGLAGGFAFGWLVAPTIYARKRMRAVIPMARARRGDPGAGSLVAPLYLMILLTAWSQPPERS